MFELLLNVFKNEKLTETEKMENLYKLF